MLIATGRWKSIVLLEQWVHHELDQWQRCQDPAYHVPRSLQELQESLEQVLPHFFSLWQMKPLSYIQN